MFVAKAPHLEMLDTYMDYGRFFQGSLDSPCYGSEISQPKQEKLFSLYPHILVVCTLRGDIYMTSAPGGGEEGSGHVDKVREVA